MAGSGIEGAAPAEAAPRGGTVSAWSGSPANTRCLPEPGGMRAAPYPAIGSLHVGPLGFV